MFNRSILTLVALCAVSAASLSAQPFGEGTGKRMGRGMHGGACMQDAMHTPKLDCLKLTDAQKEQIKALREKAKADMDVKAQAAKEAHLAFREANRNQATPIDTLKALHQKSADARFALIQARRDLHAAIGNLLTPEQKAQWEAKRGDRKGVRGECTRGEGKRGMGRKGCGMR